MGKKKVDLGKINNINEVVFLLNNNEEVTLFIDNVRKYITIGYDANSVRIVDFGVTKDLINVLKNAKVAYEHFYGANLYFVNLDQLTTLLTPYIVQGKLCYCPSNIALHSVYS